MARIPTITLCLVKKYAADTEGYIKIKIWIPGTNRFILKSTGYKLPPSAWDPINEIVRRQYPDSIIINKQISKDRDQIEQLLKDQLEKGTTEFTRDIILRLIDPPTVTGDFLQFYLDHIRYLETKFSPQYCAHFIIELKQLTAAFPGLSFAAINTPLLEKYEMTLKKYATTTIHTKMKRLKEVIDKAIAQGHIQTKAIAGYKFPTYEAPDRPYLTLADTIKIWNAIIKKEFDHSPPYKKVACYFLIECYSGIRFSDWSRFKIETLIHQRALKVRAKKNGENIYLPFNIFKRLGKICDYVIKNNITFDLPESRTNGLLKVLNAQLKFNIHLTTHIGRHTCGTLLGEMGYNNIEIAEVLGISPQTALTYIRQTKQGLKNTFLTKGGL